MTTAYSTNLGLALPVQGELSGTWGDTVNNGITQYSDISIAGTLTLNGDGAVTLSLTNGNASGTNIGSTTAQYAILKITGTTTAKVITAPSSSKTYTVINASSYDVTVKASGQTGVTIPAGDKAFIAFNGTDYVRVGASAGGSNTQVQYNNNGNLAGSANFTFNGTTATINTLSLTNALTVGNGGTGVSTLTAYGLLTGGTTSTGALQQVSGTGTSGQVLTSNGASALPSWQTFSSPAQAGGALIVNTTTATTSYTVPTGSNAMSVGPITVASGVTVTVSSGQRWVVL